MTHKYHKIHGEVSVESHKVRWKWIVVAVDDGGGGGGTVVQEWWIEVVAVLSIGFGI